MTDIATPTPQHQCAALSGSRLRRWLVASAASMAALAGAPANAEIPMRLIDECHEATAGLRLPSTAAGGSIDAELCEGCGLTRLTFEDGTRFLLGGSDVPYPQWLTAAQASEAPFVLCFRPQTRAITRLIIDQPRLK